MFELNKQLEQLDEQGTPIRLAFIGAGAMGMNFIGQTVMAPGMEPRIVVDVKVDNAVHASYFFTIPKTISLCARRLRKLRKRLMKGKYVCTNDVSVIYEVDNIDMVCECTGVVSVGTRYCFDAIRNKKHVVSLSVEMDVVVGHILSMFAKNAGVTYTGIYGDEPGVIKLLYDQAKALGFTVVAAGRGDTW